jgi:hypothetical protein
MKITEPHSLAWELFAMLDEEADAREASVANVLDVAAIIVANYVEKMRAELKEQGLNNPRHCDRAAWFIFRERTRALLEQGEREKVH